MLRIPKRFVDVNQLRHDLTVKNGAYWAAVQNNRPTNAEPELYLWQEEGNYVLVPRNYEPPWLYHSDSPSGRLVRALPVVQTQRKLGKPFDLSFRGKLRDKIQEDACAALAKPGRDKILALACGKGKTTCSLYSLLERGRTGLPALVVVHTNELADQWEERIKQFWGIESTQIGRVQQKRFDWKDKPITIAMLHTLCKKHDRWPKEFFEYFKVVIFDEIHHLGAEFFGAACTMFPGERWGLSATLKRDDGMDKVIKLHCGEVAYEYLKQDLKPKTFILKTGVRVNENKYRLRNGRTNLAKLTTDLSRMPQRNDMIVQWIDKAAEQGRKIIVLGERTEQLCVLFDKIKWENKAICTGSVSSRDGSRRKALEADIVLATQHLAKEGLDQATLDTLFILQPFSGEGRFRQSVGRILRVVPGVEKKPRVLIFEDDIGIMVAMSGKLKNAMYKLGFDYKEIRA